MTERSPVENVNDFFGLVNNIDPTSIPSGAASSLLNLNCKILGQISTRKGLLPITFESVVTVGVGPD